MKNLLLSLIVTLLLFSCVGREPLRFCTQKAPERITYSFQGNFPKGSSLDVVYSNMWGDTEHFIAYDNFTFTVYFDRSVIQRRIIAELNQYYSEDNITGVFTVREGSIILG